MNRLQQIPASILASALLWVAALAIVPLVVHAQPTVTGAFAGVTTLAPGGFDESTDESATVANAATSSSDADATVAGAATATYPNAAGVGGTAGAESTGSLLSPLGVSIGFSNGLVFGEFVASSNGTASSGMVNLSLNVVGDLILIDRDPVPRLGPLISSGVGVVLTLDDPVAPGSGTELFAAFLEISRFGAFATTITATGGWEDSGMPVDGVSKDATNTPRGLDSDCDAMGETHTCTVAVDITSTIMLMVDDGQLFSLLLDLGTNVFGAFLEAVDFGGFGEMGIEMGAFFLGSADVSFDSQTVTINPVPARVQVPEPTTLLLLGLSLAGLGLRGTPGRASCSG